MLHLNAIAPQVSVVGVDGKLPVTLHRAILHTNGQFPEESTGSVLLVGLHVCTICALTRSLCKIYHDNTFKSYSTIGISAGILYFSL